MFRKDDDAHFLAQCAATIMGALLSNPNLTGTDDIDWERLLNDANAAATDLIARARATCE